MLKKYLSVMPFICNTYCGCLNCALLGVEGDFIECKFKENDNCIEFKPLDGKKYYYFDDVKSLNSDDKVAKFILKKLNKEKVEDITKEDFVDKFTIIHKIKKLKDKEDDNSKWYIYFGKIQMPEIYYKIDFTEPDPEVPIEKFENLKNGSYYYNLFFSRAKDQDSEDEKRKWYQGEVYFITKK